MSRKTLEQNLQKLYIAIGDGDKFEDDYAKGRCAVIDMNLHRLNNGKYDIQPFLSAAKAYSFVSTEGDSSWQYFIFKEDYLYKNGKLVHKPSKQVLAETTPHQTEEKIK